MRLQGFYGRAILQSVAVLDEEAESDRLGANRRMKEAFPKVVCDCESGSFEGMTPLACIVKRKKTNDEVDQR